MGEFMTQGFRGRLIGTSDKDYNAARALYNGRIDKRPEIIARCTDAADVMAAVNYARDNKLLLAIRRVRHLTMRSGATSLMSRMILQRRIK